MRLWVANEPQSGDLSRDWMARSATAIGRGGPFFRSAILSDSELPGGLGWSRRTRIRRLRGRVRLAQSSRRPRRRGTARRRHAREGWTRRSNRGRFSLPYRHAGRILPAREVPCSWTMTDNGKRSRHHFFAGVVAGGAIGAGGCVGGDQPGSRAG